MHASEEPPSTGAASQVQPALEDRVTSLLRSRGARYAGLAFGLASIIFLVVQVRQAGLRGAQLLEAQSAWSIAGGTASFLVIHTAALVVMRALTDKAPTWIWVSAQLVKYLPAPGSAMFGMVGTAVRQGHETRAALGLMTRHTVLLAGGALVVGGPAFGMLASRYIGHLGIAAGATAVGAGIAALILPTRGLSPQWRVAAIASATAGWVLGGLGLWAASAAGMGNGLAVSSAFAAAWVVGLLALPVPAGIGVREAVLLLLLGPVIGQQEALAFGIVTRVVHMLSDAVMIAVLLPAARRRRPILSRNDPGDPQ
jgi:glycosyltransferase 2 family protein